MVESREQLFSWDVYDTNLNHPSWDLSPNDQRILAVGTLAQGAGRYIVVTNWFEELRQRMGN